MKPLVILLIILATATSAAAQRTSRQRLRPDVPAAAATPPAPMPTAVAMSGDSVAVSLAGYDKPLRSARESFHAVNADTLDIVGMTLTFTYMDTSGRMLHRCSRHIDADIPAGETRMVTVPSWDRQKVFYYINSAPARSAGTPYDVTIDIDSVFVAPIVQNIVNEH